MAQMTTEVFNKTYEELEQIVRNTLVVKGSTYTDDDEDRLKNFNNLEAIMSVDKEKLSAVEVCLLMYLKQMDAAVRSIRKKRYLEGDWVWYRHSNMDSPVPVDGLKQRLLDIIVYTYLLYASIEAEVHGAQTTKKEVE